MQFHTSARRPAPGTAAKDGLRKGKGSLSIYSAPPVEEVSLEEFERFAMDRLRVLKEIDSAKSLGRKDEEMRKIVNDQVEKHLLNEGSWDENTRKDQISHHVLRLAYCRSEELRRWFLANEATLFRYRFRDQLTSSEKETFMAENDMPYTMISQAEVNEVKEQLYAITKSVFPAGQAKEAQEAANAILKGTGGRFYKVPFEEVPELVSTRRVLLRRGAAFVPAEQLAAIVVGQFRTRLSKALVTTLRHWSAHVAPEEHDRLAPLVEALSQRYLGPAYGDGDGVAREGVAAADVPALARKHFPLCMSNLYNRLHDERHLRHVGRLQLGLFLKGIGLPMEESLAFWRQEFSPKTAPDKFEKNYAYNIRHNYGREGNRKDYTPYSCMKVISDIPGAGDHHGCPYRTFGAEQLKNTLKGMRIKDNVVNDVLDKVANHHYQLACGAVFEGSHGCACDSGINHPNEYFDKSREVEAEAAAAAPSPVTPAAPASGTQSRTGGATPLSIPPMPRH